MAQEECAAKNIQAQPCRVEVVELVLLCLLGLAFARCAVGQQDTRNVVLVIANSGYDGSAWPALPNALGDARLIAEKLAAIGFEVETPAINLGGKDLKARLEAFRRKLSGLPQESMVWIYYAGHGIQINGTNFIVPIGAPSVDAAIGDGGEGVEENAARNFIPINRLIDALGERTAGSRFGANIIVLDACRSNPLSRSGRRARGLADTPLTANTLIAYSASAGRTADDGKPNSNSPYALSFVAALDQAYLPLELLFNSITLRVVMETQGMQRPEYRTGLAGFYCIRKCGLALPADLKALAASASATAVDAVAGGGCSSCPTVQRMRLPSGVEIEVGLTVVTNGQWKKCVEELGCPSLASAEDIDDLIPVVGVSWDEAQRYLVWLTNISGRQYRLPSSDEWSQIIKSSRGISNSTGPNSLVPVQIGADKLMLDQGVSEWTSTCASKSGAQSCDSRVVRGRSWRNSNGEITQTQRHFVSARGDAVGFRVIRE